MPTIVYNHPLYSFHRGGLQLQMQYLGLSQHVWYIKADLSSSTAFSIW